MPRDRLQFRPAEPGDADLPGLHPRLRDRLEIQASVGRDPTATLRAGIATSKPCWAVMNRDGVLLALFGVVPDANPPRSGMIWLLRSDHLASHRFTVLRASRAWVARLHEHYDYFWNYIDARNDLHIDWVRWCGFRFVGLEERHGFEQRPFWRIERTRNG